MKNNKFIAAICRFFGKINQKWLNLKPKSTDRLTQIEEKYDFPATHIVGHVGTAVAIIVCIVGVIMVIWGLTPVIKRSVSAPKMVEQQEVTAQQVQECAQNMKPAARTSGARKPAARRVVSREGDEESEALPPDVSLAKLQVFREEIVPFPGRLAKAMNGIAVGICSSVLGVYVDRNEKVS